uniref:Type I restriction enzyme R protein N terminus (HSDR_N) n=1 Tax=Candidatus Kentrum sp. MB TaxID=2138164 RepID=A0A451BDI8_9GAMM|nr:MAG: hypothetical protein BECKMB1821I_GA0114274_106511 [Candidatus Kentron sp. MB]VFK76352.1 MAG: hypothetical protein BECKMB1821H_GA0114242_10534 [Candidatus Kentron sp. MB]
MKKSILEENRSYTFSDYSKLPYPTRDIVAEFGYRFIFEQMDLPKKDIGHIDFDALRSVFYKKLPHISLGSEAAKREFLVSPLFLELLNYVEVEIDVGYPLNAGDRLKGYVDYILRSFNTLIVIEAKNSELDKGFTQLAVELIAMHEYLGEDDTGILYGAVTMGDMWRFGALDRENKIITKNIDAFLIPADIAKLFSVFLGILN